MYVANGSGKHLYSMFIRCFHVLYGEKKLKHEEGSEETRFWQGLFIYCWPSSHVVNGSGKHLYSMFINLYRDPLK